MFVDAPWYDFAAVHFAATLIEGLFLGFIVKTGFDVLRSRSSAPQESNESDFTSLICEVETLRAVAAASGNVQRALDVSTNPFQKSLSARNDTPPATSFLLARTAAA